MVLKHQGVPEFDPPENYDPLLLRGDHIVVFKVRLPDNQSEQMKDILEKIIKNDQENKKTYYANKAELEKKQNAELKERMDKKRTKAKQADQQ